MKKIKVLLIALILILGGIFFSQVNAVNLGAQETRPFSDDNGDGTVGNNTYRFLKGSAGLTRGYTIFKIYEDGDTTYSKAYYCLRGRVGFGATADSDVTTGKIAYTKLGEMHENASNIISKYQEYYGVNLDATKNITFQGVEHRNVNIYNAILWVLDNSYIPADNSSEGYIAEDYKNELLNKAGISETGIHNSEKITKDDIEVIQQLAIWYFANYNENDEVTLSRRDEVARLLGLISDKNNDSYVNNIFAGVRGANLNKLYQYIINGAIEGNEAYGNGDTRILGVQKRTFDKSLMSGIESLNYRETQPNVYHPKEYYYKVGPFKIGTNRRNVISNSDITLLDAEGTVVPRYYKFKDELTNNDTIYEIYYFVDRNGERPKILQEEIEYYIMVEKLFTKGFKLGTVSALANYDFSEVTLKIVTKYSDNKADFYIRGNADQPVAELNKKVIEEYDEITIETPKEFDLSLRKFITSIERNGNNIEIADRTPSIDTTTLVNGITNRKGEKEYTATYRHPKNALSVETDDKVVYTIRVYNEGEVAGTATEVTDYLPEGLELIPAEESEINRRYGWKNPSGDGKTITTDYLKDTTIKGYDLNKVTEEAGWQKAATGNSGLYYADVQVECKVVAQVGAQDKALRNIAAITADTGDDRDSIPGDPGRNDYNPPEDNSTYKEDDDDYENLVLKAKFFDLSLRKFITSIKRNGNNVEIADRTPSIDTTTLENGVTNAKGEKEYTATYRHPKNALSVETDDKVVYTIRVYNEGEIAGTATEVTDYLPEGLELIPAEESEINRRYGWKNPSGDGKTITTDYLKDTTIKGYDLNKVTEEAGWQKAATGNSGLYYADVQVECKVVAQVGAQDKALRNIAAITADTGDDRDSIPGDPGRNDYNPPEDNSTYKEDDDDYENLVLKTKIFDLSLRKFITKVERINKTTSEKEQIPMTSREPVIEIKALKDGTATTARYIHPKNKISLKRGDIIYYTIRVYNEGDLDGYATEVKDYLPEGLELVEGQNEIWTENGNTLTTDVLKDQKLLAYDRNLTTAPTGVNWQKASDDETGLYYYDLTVVCRIKDTVQDGVTLTNIAEITADKSIPTDIDDRDSEPNNFPDDSKNNNYEGNGNENGFFPGKQDDDDFERVIVEPDQVFDLSLRKFITSIKRGGQEIQFASRTPSIDTTTLINGTFDRNGNKEYTATYEHSKEPLIVKKGDIITYTIRVYNEGELDGYASEITDYIPEGLALINLYKTNFDNLWELQTIDDSNKTIKLVGENGFYKTEEDAKGFKIDDFQGITNLSEVELVSGKVSIKTKQLDDELLKAFDKNKTAEEAGWQKAEKGEGGLYYKDVQVACLVIAENTYKETITNIAEISEDKDKDGNDVTDRDSNPDDKKDPYTTWQEDDDDYEPVVLRYFDLALRKFITGVETNGKLSEVTSRIPQLTIDETTGNIKYTHPKEEAPVKVANNDVVIYTLRIYNEGTIAGYAEEITDDIPEGLVFLPDYNVNKEYQWKMIDKDGNVTDKADEAVEIKTEYLSEGKGQSENRNNLINPFDSSKAISTEQPFNPDYRDVKVAFKVTEPNTSDRIIINKAQISEDSDDDEDSDPHKWTEGEDDQDREYLYVKYFDLSLLKWVTKTKVAVDGKTTITETGFKPNTGKTETKGIRDNDKIEPVAKVELDRKKLDRTTVKFVYKIRVTNEGEIAGYATEVTDFIPKGLEFKAEDNKEYGWTKDGDDKVITRALESVLLQPGESAELEIVFTWKNDKNNLGIKTNIAEITEDYNEYNSKDIDSTPDNKKDPYEKEQEDDDDFALVILSIKTGKEMSYTLLIMVVVTLLAGGIYLIKKYVLES